MSQLNDAQYQAFRDQGFTGALNDMELQWLQANGATSSNVNDAWREVLAAQGHDGHRNDALYALMGDLGFEGALNDRLIDFWRSGGALVGPLIRIEPNNQKVFESALPGGTGGGDVTVTGQIIIDYRDPAGPALSDPLTIQGNAAAISVPIDGSLTPDIDHDHGQLQLSTFTKDPDGPVYTASYTYELQSTADHSVGIVRNAFIIKATDDQGSGADSETERNLIAVIEDDKPIARFEDFVGVNTADTVLFETFGLGFAGGADGVPQQPLGPGGGVSIKQQGQIGEATVRGDGWILYDADDFEADDGDLDTVIYTITDADGSESDGRLRYLISSLFDALVIITDVEPDSANPARSLKIDWIVSGNEANDIDSWTIGWSNQQIGGEWNTLVSGLPGAARTFTDTTLDPEQERFYRVIGVDVEPATRFTDPSAPEGGTTQPYPAPADLEATFDNIDTVTLAWDYDDVDQTGFTIFRSSDGENFSQIGTALPAARTFDDSTVAALQTYTYYVRSDHPGGFGANSETTQITVLIIPGRASRLLLQLQDGVALDFLDRSYAVKQNGGLIAGGNWTQDFDTDPGNGLLHPGCRLPNGLIGYAPHNRLRGSQQMNDSRWYRQLITTSPVPGLRGEEATEVTCDGSMGEHYFGTYRASRRADYDARVMYRVRKESGDADYIHMYCWNNEGSSTFPGPEVSGVFDLNTMQWIPGSMGPGVMDYGSYEEDDGYYTMWHEFRMVGGDRNANDLYRLSISNDQNNKESNCSGVIRLCMPQWTYCPNEDFDVHLWTRMDTGSSSSGYARHLPAVNYDPQGNCEGRYFQGSANEPQRLCANARLEYWDGATYGGTGLRDGMVNCANIAHNVTDLMAPNGSPRASRFTGDGSTEAPFLHRQDGEYRQDDFLVGAPTITTPYDNAVASVFLAPYNNHRWVRLEVADGVYQDFDIIAGMLGSSQGIDDAKLVRETGPWVQIKVQAKGMADIGHWKLTMLAGDGDDAWPGGNPTNAGLYFWLPMRTALDINVDEFNTSQVLGYRASPNGPCNAKWGEMDLPFWPPSDNGGSYFIQFKSYALDHVNNDGRQAYLATGASPPPQSDLGVPPGMPEILAAGFGSPFHMVSGDYNFTPEKLHLGFSFLGGPSVGPAVGSVNGGPTENPGDNWNPPIVVSGDYTHLGASGPTAYQAFVWTPQQMTQEELDAITGDLNWPAPPVVVGLITGLKAEPTGQHGEILLEWNRHMGIAERIEIERKENDEGDETYSLVKEISANRKRWRDRDVPKNEEYAYRLRLIDDDTGTIGPWCNPVTESPDW